MSIHTEGSDAAEKLSPRERVLSAALELFVEQGYFNTNVPDISKRSKCSVGSIYHHFLNKEEIASELYKECILNFRNVLSESFDPNDDIEVVVKSMIVTFLNYAESNETLARYLWLARHNEFLSNKVLKPTTVGFDRLGKKLTKAIKNGIRREQIGNIKAEIIWSLIFGIPLSYLRDWLDGYNTMSPTQVSETLADAVWGALSSNKG